MPDRDLIAEGREKLAAATPGTAYVHDANADEGHPPRPLWVVQNTAAIFDGTDEDDALNVVVDIGTKADAELIAHMRNTYEQLLDIVDEARKRLASHEKSVHWMRQQRDDARARIAELERENIRLSGIEQLHAEIGQPLGYVVLAKRPDRGQPARYRLSTAGDIWDDLEPVESHRDYCEDQAATNPRWYRGVEYVIAELREVTDHGDA